MTLADRLRAALAAEREHPLLLADDESDRVTYGDGSALPAAVLVPVVDRPEPGVILTLRPETMRKHPGQVAFPGGRVDADDEDAIAAALREAEEEIGLIPHHVEIVGMSDRYRTVTGFEVTPVVGVIPPDLLLVPNPHEVAAVFEVPLRHLLEPSHRVVRWLERDGVQLRYYEIMWEDRRIWGATAAMIVNLSQRLAVAL